MIGVLLENPKYPHNVGAAIRAAAAFGAARVHWSGERVLGYERQIEGQAKTGERLPREERMRSYGELVRWARTESHRPLNLFPRDATPVCVELLPGSEPLWTFDHPARAVYVFGPEDGDVTVGLRHACHRFVYVPTVGGLCLNLAMTVNVVLAHRKWTEDTLGFQETAEA